MINTIGINNLIDDFHQSSVSEVYEYFRSKKWIAVDTETNGKDPHQHKIISLQLGDPDNQWFIDCRTTDIRLFKELLEDKSLIFQNYKFDYKFFKHVGIFPKEVWDTMIAECVLYCGYEKWGYGLDDLVTRYLGVTMNKETRVDFLSIKDKPFESRHIKYGCLDVIYLPDIKSRQESKARELELERCIDLENQVIPAFGDIEYNGLGFDPKEWMAIANATEEEAFLLVKQLNDIVLNDSILSKIYKPLYVQGNLFGEPETILDINYASPVQVGKICKELGYPLQSTSEQHLLKLKNKHPFFKSLMELRKKNKIVSTYGENFLDYINPVTGRIHTSFWQVKDTGRVSSGSRVDNTPNVQNIPADNRFRNCFKAREGYSWVSGDYTGQELAIMAFLSQEEIFIKSLNNGEDLHSNSASILFNKKITKENNKKERDAAKTITFGLCYGMGYKKLADSLEISEEEAKTLLNLYEKSFPTVMCWLNKIGKKAKIEGKTVTNDIYKRVRWYPEMDKAKGLRSQRSQDWKTILSIEGSTEREGKNHMVQGAAANMTKEAMIEIRNLIHEYNSKYGKTSVYLISQVHDSIECESRNDIAEGFSRDMKKVMINVGNKHLKGVKISVDMTIGKYWNK